MKTSIALAMTLALLLVGIALVQGKPSGAASRGTQKEVFGMFDTDGNGLVDWEEMAAFQGISSTKSKAIIKTWDKNNDDKLSLEEFFN